MHKLFPRLNFYYVYNSRFLEYSLRYIPKDGERAKIIATLNRVISRIKRDFFVFPLVFVLGFLLKINLRLYLLNLRSRRFVWYKQQKLVLPRFVRRRKRKIKKLKKKLKKLPGIKITGRDDFMLSPNNFSAFIRPLSQRFSRFIISNAYIQRYMYLRLRKRRKSRLRLRKRSRAYFRKKKNRKRDRKRFTRKRAPAKTQRLRAMKIKRVDKRTWIGPSLFQRMYLNICSLMFLDVRKYLDWIPLKRRSKDPAKIEEFELYYENVHPFYKNFFTSLLFIYDDIRHVIDFRW